MLLRWSLVVFAVLDLAIWNAPLVTAALPFYLAMFAVIGLPAVIMGAGMVSVLQLHAADEVRGRVLATFLSFYDASQALGMALAGALVPLLGLTALLSARAVLFLVAALFVPVKLDVPVHTARGDISVGPRRDPRAGDTRQGRAAMPSTAPSSPHRRGPIRSPPRTPTGGPGRRQPRRRHAP